MTSPIREDARAYTKALILLISVIALLSLSTAQTADSQNDLEVNVSIASQTIIDIQPSKFAWGYGGTNLYPGSLAGPDFEINSYGRIQIENLGSNNISNVWFNNTQPTQRPFGTGSSNAYDSANFLAIDYNVSGEGDSNSFIGRKEYGIDSTSSQDIIYLNTPSGWDFGRFRNSSYEYFWTVNDDGTTLDGATFRIGIDHHNESQTGSTDLVGGSFNEYTLTNVTNNGGDTWWAVTEVEVGADDVTTLSNDGGVEYCVAMNASQVMSDNPPEVEFIKWNKGHPAVRAAGAGSGCDYATNYTVGGSAPTQDLVPGDWITMNIRAKIPYGVVSGSLPTGNLFVLASSQ